MNGLALCAGVGGLELGIGLALGSDYRTVGYCERETFPASTLVARMEDSSLDQAPIWDDLETFPGKSYRGKVDIISAGFPCQPFSTAGSKKGLDDERWLWPLIDRIVCDVGPRFVFLENVPGLIDKGLGEILGALAEAGFDAEVGCFTASEVGASHKRERIFILAHAVAYSQGNGNRRKVWNLRQENGGQGLAHLFGADGPSRSVADTQGQRQPGLGGQSGVKKEKPSSVPCGEDLGDTDKPRLDKRRALSGSKEISRPGQGVREMGNTPGEGLEIGRPRAPWNGSLPTFPPGPKDFSAWEEWIREGGPEPALRRDADGMAYRVDRVRACGNGVVPLEAAYAFFTLATRGGLI